MSNFSDGEREFLEHGGVIWCVQSDVPGTWHVVKQYWEGVEILEHVASTADDAIRWLYLLADLANPDDKMAIHHAIPRGCGDERYPILTPSSNAIAHGQ